MKRTPRLTFILRYHGRERFYFKEWRRELRLRLPKLTPRLSEARRIKLVTWLNERGIFFRYQTNALVERASANLKLLHAAEGRLQHHLEVRSTVLAPISRLRLSELEPDAYEALPKFRIEYMLPRSVLERALLEDKDPLNAQDRIIRYLADGIRDVALATMRDLVANPGTRGPSIAEAMERRLRRKG